MKKLRCLPTIALLTCALVALVSFQASAQVTLAPAITTPPASLTVAAGANATFSVVATGTAPLAYQWFKGDAAITSATSATLTLNAVTVADAGTYKVKVSNALSSVTSAAATLTVTTATTPPPSTDVAPKITTQPASLIVATGASATFTVAATGTPAPRFQWFKNGREIERAESATFVIASAQLEDAAVYTVKIFNSAGSATSAAASLAVNAVAGTITSAPASVTAKAGTDVKFTVAATGTGLTFQWRFNGRAISGATAATFTVSNVGTTSGGIYSVAVLGALASASPTFTVTGNTTVGQEGEDHGGFRPGGASIAAVAAAALAVTTDARLVNIATRGHVGEDDEVLISGFVTRGAGSKKILMRAVGPTLGTQFKVADALAAPTLTLFHDGKVVDTNSSWGGSATLVATFAQVGAFPLVAGSADAALIETLNSGAYSATVTAPKGASGVALVEVYDTDTGSPAAEVVNISTRALVGAEAKDTLIAGFAISGTTSDTVMIRGVGPSLGTLFGLRRALGNSHVTVFDAKGNQVAANTVWGSSRHPNGDEDDDHEDNDKEDDMDGASDRVGAWHLPRGSQDSALLLTLAPGVYTAHVTGVNGKSGIALVEIYEVH